jgi:hypothetical protein
MTILPKTSILDTVKELQNLNCKASEPHHLELCNCLVTLVPSFWRPGPDTTTSPPTFAGAHSETGCPMRALCFNVLLGGFKASNLLKHFIIFHPIKENANLKNVHHTTGQHAVGTDHP